MATHSGSEGKVFVENSQIAEVKSWSLEVTADTVDASTIGSSWRKSHPTIKSWSGGFEAFWDDEDKNGQGKLSAGSTVTLNLYPEGDEEGNIYFTGKVIVTSVSYKASFDGLVEASFSFTGTESLNQEIVKPPKITKPKPSLYKPLATDNSNVNKDIKKPIQIKETIEAVETKKDSDLNSKTEESK